MLHFGKPYSSVNANMCCCFLGWQERPQLEQCPPISGMQTPAPPSFPAWCCLLGAATLLSTAMQAFLHAAEGTSDVAWGGVVTGVLYSKAQPVAVLLSSVEVFMHAPHKSRGNVHTRCSWLSRDGRGVQCLPCGRSKILCLTSRH